MEIWCRPTYSAKTVVATLNSGRVVLLVWVIRLMTLRKREAYYGTVTVAVKRSEVPAKTVSLVRKEGLEPSRCYPPDPKSGASANSATLARLLRSAAVADYQ